MKTNRNRKKNYCSWKWQNWGQILKRVTTEICGLSKKSTKKRQIASRSEEIKKKIWSNKYLYEKKRSKKYYIAHKKRGN